MESAEFSNQGLAEIRVRPVERGEEARYQEQMAQHHYLGALAKIGETAWYVATWREQWVAQLSFSAAALKCGVRDRWIEVPISLPSRSGCLNLQPTSVTKLLKHHIFSDDFLSKVIYRLPPPPSEGGNIAAAISEKSLSSFTANKLRGIYEKISNYSAYPEGRGLGA